MITAIKLRGDTTERWALNNPVLLLRETVLDTTLNKFKIGNFILFNIIDVITGIYTYII